MRLLASGTFARRVKPLQRASSSVQRRSRSARRRRSRTTRASTAAAAAAAAAVRRAARTLLARQLSKMTNRARARASLQRRRRMATRVSTSLFQHRSSSCPTPTIRSRCAHRRRLAQAMASRQLVTTAMSTTLSTTIEACYAFRTSSNMYIDWSYGHYF